MIRETIRAESWWLIPTLLAYDIFMTGVIVGKALN